MGAGPRTVLRVIVGSIILIYLLYHSQQSGLFTKSNALISGILLVAMGALTFFFAARFDKEVPDLQEKLTPVWGYGLPKRGQLAVRYSIVALGAGLSIWSFF